MESTEVVTLRLSRPIGSVRLHKEGLKALALLLEERVEAAAALELAQWKQGDRPNEKFEQDKKTFQALHVLSLTVKGTDNKELFGTVNEVFSSPNFPEQVLSFYANSETLLRVRHNYVPLNGVTLLLDFQKPHPFDFNFLPSYATANESNFVVQGKDATWTNGLFNELSTFFAKREVPLKFHHRASVWDGLLWLVGIPVALWVCYRSAPFVDKAFPNSTFLEAATYIYIVLVTINFLRGVFHYSRWVWPRAEYVGAQNRALKHRVVLGAIAVSIAGAVIYDVIKLALK